MEETIDNVGAVPREVSAERGLLLGNSRRAYALGVDPFVAPEQTRHWTRAPRSHTQPSVSQGPDATEVTRPSGVGNATLCAVDSQIKQGRGFRQFLLRGLEKVNGEWS